MEKSEGRLGHLASLFAGYIGEEKKMNAMSFWKTFISRRKKGIRIGGMKGKSQGGFMNKEGKKELVDGY
jgi:hypothetical protein